MKRRTICCLVLFGGLAAAVPSGVLAEPETPAATESIEQELAHLNESLDEIVALLRSYMDGQRFELMLQRMEVTQSGLAVKERELEDLREQRASTETEAERLEDRMDDLREDPEGMGVDEDQVDGVLAEWEHHLKVMKDRIWRLDQRLIDLDKQVTRQREDLLDWERALGEAFR